MTQSTEYTGCPALREWLVGKGFNISRNHLDRSLNRCDWYAYRCSELPARVCECNNDKVGVQIVVYPHDIETPGGQSYTGAEVELCSMAAGTWWKLRAYSMTPEDVMERFPAIEKNLVAAWNAIGA